MNYLLYFEISDMMRIEDAKAVIISHSLRLSEVVCMTVCRKGRLTTATCSSTDETIARIRYLFENNPTEKIDFSDLQLSA